MASYGRNLEFRVPPQHGQRGGRFFNSTVNAIAIGAPVTHDGDDADALGRLGVELATAGPPIKGLSGILVYEAESLNGFDPVLYSASDMDTAPAGRSVQVVSGDHVKVVLKNTADRKFLNTRDYKGRKMVAGDLTTINVGDYLTPGTGSDAAGYWAVTGTAANHWLVVEGVDSDRGEVEARFVF